MRATRPVVIDLDGTVCLVCGLAGAAVQWVEQETPAGRAVAGRLPQLEVQLVDELGLLVAVCLCGAAWWIGPLL